MSNHAGCTSHSYQVIPEQGKFKLVPDIDSRGHVIQYGLNNSVK